MREVKFARTMISDPISAATMKPVPNQLLLLGLPNAERGVFGSAGGASGPRGGAMRRRPDAPELRSPPPAAGETIFT